MSSRTPSKKQHDSLRRDMSAVGVVHRKASRVASHKSPYSKVAKSSLKRSLSEKNIQIKNTPPKKPLPKAKCTTSNKVGMKIFNNFVKDILANNHLGGSRKLLSNRLTNLEITSHDFSSLMEIVDMYEWAFEKIVNDVRNNLKFTPKSGSGAKPVHITKPQHWMEAIIQMQNTIKQFDAIFIDALNRATSPKGKKQSCKRTPVRECWDPCTVKGKGPNMRCTHIPKP